MAEKTLKLTGEPGLPGLSLPKAFDDLQAQFELVASHCKHNGSHEAQTAGLLLVCNELQRLLRLSFIENGILASRIEILTRCQDDFVKKIEKRVRGFEIEQSVTRRYLKKLRTRQYNYEKVRKNKNGDEWWKVHVTNSDYETITGLSRTSGSPNLEFMLRLNQLLLDFVQDPYTNELLLPPMGSEERAELSKLASLYKLRCRFNKSTQVATSTIIKARQTCVPASGEVDSVLNTFSKKQKDNTEEDAENTLKDEKDPMAEVAPDTQGNSKIPKETTKDSSDKNSNTVDSGGDSAEAALMPPSSIPSCMLTPVATLGAPTITLESDYTVAQKDKNPPNDMESAVKANPSVRVNKTDNNTTAVANQKPIVHLLPELTPNQAALIASSPSPNVLMPSNPGGPFPSTSAALHMALLMQSQQLRALTAAATAGQSNAAQPVPGISTVLATPLPRPLPPTNTSPQPAATPKTGTKRERDNTTPAPPTTSSKRSKSKKNDQ